MKILKKADVVLIISLLLVAVLFNFFLYKSLKEKVLVGRVIVKVKGEVFKTLDFNTNQTFEIIINKEKKNTLEIKDGAVKMIYGDCQDQYCVRHQSINMTNETIVCLPNRVVIEVENTQIESEFDSIT